MCCSQTYAKGDITSVLWASVDCLLGQEGIHFNFLPPLCLVHWIIIFSPTEQPSKTLLNQLVTHSKSESPEFIWHSNQHQALTESMHTVELQLSKAGGNFFLTVGPSYHKIPYGYGQLDFYSNEAQIFWFTNLHFKYLIQLGHVH